MIIGGVRIDHPTGPVGHSDGDVLLHALTDALLGAIGADDLGTLFPNNDPANADRDSAEFVAEAVRRVQRSGLRVLNVDCTIIAERPKLSPIRTAISETVAGLLGVTPECVNVKGKTHEGVDAVGRGEAIEAHVIALLGQ
jgi:2-C-methyl-D-erythritol 2,4-cyclodiphosphate synthase